MLIQKLAKYDLMIFPSGDVVLREEPYAAVLRAIFRVNHCAHCLKKIPTPVPCFECATVRLYQSVLPWHGSNFSIESTLAYLKSSLNSREMSPCPISKSYLQERGGRAMNYSIPWRNFKLCQEHDLLSST